MKTRVYVCDLTHHPDAIAFLQQPQLCPYCEGRGYNVFPILLAPEVLHLVQQPCQPCQGSGYVVWSSWN